MCLGIVDVNDTSRCSSRTLGTCVCRATVIQMMLIYTFHYDIHVHTTYATVQLA